MGKRECPLCGEEQEEEPAVHDVVKCEKTELVKGRATIIKLKDSVNAWKDSWYKYRDTVGELMWRGRTMPRKYSPTQELDMSAGDANLILRGTQVYRREGTGWKLIGVGKDEEAAQAVLRLMLM